MKKILKHTWTVILNLLTIGIIVNIYSSLYESFEKIVVSILILIYLNINTFFATNSQTMMKTLINSENRFIELKKLIGQNKDSNYFSKEELEVAEAEDKVKKVETKFYINMIFNFIMYVIAIVNLLSSI